MSTAKEKAKELFDYYDELLTYIESKNIVKQCTIKAVDEILNINSVDKDYDLSNYWNEVKLEIEKL